MTIALGFTCTEGVGIVSDSMRVNWVEPWPVVDLDGSIYGPKIVWLAERQFAAVASGCFTEVWAPRLVAAGSFEVMASTAFESLRAIRDYEKLPVREASLIVAGMGRVAVLATDREPRLLGPDTPGIVVGGAMSVWAAEHGLEAQAVPPSMADAVAFVVAACRQFVTESYRGWGIEHLLNPTALRAEVARPGGAVPPVAYPLHLACFSLTETTEMEINYESL